MEETVTALDHAGMLGVIMLVVLFLGLQIVNVNSRQRSTKTWLASVLFLGSAFILGLGLWSLQLKFRTQYHSERR